MTVDVLILSNDQVMFSEANENVKKFFGVSARVLCGAESIAKGYNLLASQSDADILCFMHQDARVGFSSDVLFEYFKGLHKPGVLGFCGSSRQIPGKQWHECQPTYGGLIQGKGDQAHPLMFSPVTRFLPSGKHGFQPVQTLDGYCLFIRRSVFNEIGGFDEQYEGWHGYDIDICTKAMTAGYQNYVINQSSEHFSWGASGRTLDLALSRFKEKWEMKISEINPPVKMVVPAKDQTRKGKLKICVYTICKNELQFCERFAKSCEDADGIYVLDTGSTDGTPDALEKLGVHVQVVPFDKWNTIEEYDKLVAEGKNPWRFDVSRNMSIDMVPEDADVLVCIDMDEVLVPGWRKMIEDVWSPGINHLSYFFAWSMNGDKPHNMFWYEKIHSRKGYVWVSPVHEAIVPVHGFEDHRAGLPQLLVKHYPDPSKSRAQYLPLLELAVREAPNDPRVRFYLGREYTFKGRHQDAIDSHKHLLSMSNCNNRRERANACIQISQCYGKFKNDAIAAKNGSLADQHDRDQFNWILKALIEESWQRESWVELAEYCRLKGDNLLGYWAAKKALGIPENQCDNNYLVNPEDWKYRPHDLAAIMGWHSFNPNQLEESTLEAWEALAYSPYDMRLANNYEVCQACTAKPNTSSKCDVDIIVLSYSKTAREYKMTKDAINSLRLSSPSVGTRFVVVETNCGLADEVFAQEDKEHLFGKDVEVCYPPKPFGFNKYLKYGFDQLNEKPSESRYLVVMNNDVVLFNHNFLEKMIEGMKDVPSASPLGLREATWGLVNRGVPIDENYDINRSVNGWFLMFSKVILNAIPFDKLFPPEFTWYGGDIHYAKLLEKCGYKHGLVNAAQALHLQKQSHPLLNDGYSPPSDRDAMLSVIGVKGKRCAEIGVEQGHYSQKILAEDPASLLLVDPWKHQDESVYPNDTSNVDDALAESRYQEVQKAFGTDPRVTLCRSYSVQASKLQEDASMDFVYIDAIHTKESVLEDMNAWWPKVRAGGWLCGHDYQFGGVVDAVKEFCEKEKVKLAFVTRAGATSWAINK